MEEYLIDTKRYELRSGLENGTPNCPYGNKYQWVGYDSFTKEYLRFTKSVFRRLIQQKEINSISSDQIKNERKEFAINNVRIFTHIHLICKELQIYIVAAYILASLPIL